MQHFKEEFLFAKVKSNASSSNHNADIKSVSRTELTHKTLLSKPDTYQKARKQSQSQ